MSNELDESMFERVYPSNIDDVIDNAVSALSTYLSVDVDTSVYLSAISDWENSACNASSVLYCSSAIIWRKK